MITIQFFPFFFMNLADFYEYLILEYQWILFNKNL
nr:hypothetical protein CJLB15_00006 [Campylobacter phage CJLB-15]